MKSPSCTVYVGLAQARPNYQLPMTSFVNMATTFIVDSSDEDEQEMMATGPIPVVGQEMVGGVPKPGVAKVVVVTEPRWDPLTSPDWDKEVHTKEALVRIKR